MGAATLTFRRTRPVLGRIWQRILDDDCIDLAAQMSFYFALSMLLASVMGWLPSTGLWQSFATWMVTYLPRQSREVIFSTILRLANYSAGFLSFGLATAFWSTSAGFVSLMEALSFVYGRRDSRSYWRKHAIAACVTVFAIVFSLATFGLVVFGRWGFEIFSTRLNSWDISRPIWEIGRWVVMALIMCLGIDLMNYFLPDARRPWRWLSPGTIFIVLTLVAFSAGFNFYFQHFSSYPEIYGALGGFIILMIWIYLASFVLLVGAETDREIEKFASGSEPR